MRCDQKILINREAARQHCRGGSDISLACTMLIDSWIPGTSAACMNLVIQARSWTWDGGPWVGLAPAQREAEAESVLSLGRSRGGWSKLDLYLFERPERERCRKRGKGEASHGGTEHKGSPPDFMVRALPLRCSWSNDGCGMLTYVCRDANASELAVSGTPMSVCGGLRMCKIRRGGKPAYQRDLGRHRPPYSRLVLGVAPSERGASTARCTAPCSGPG